MSGALEDCDDVLVSTDLTDVTASQLFPASPRQLPGPAGSSPKANVRRRLPPSVFHGLRG